MIPYLIAIAIFVLDQYTKALAVSKLANGSIPLVEGVFHLTFVKNTGAAFGMFKDANAPLTVIVGLILLAVLVFLFWKKPRARMVQIGAGLVLGGAAGNLTDRITRGFVVDFFDFRLVSYPVFNIADAAVVCGAVLICIYLVFFDPSQREVVHTVGEETGEGGSPLEDEDGQSPDEAPALEDAPQKDAE